MLPDFKVATLAVGVGAAAVSGLAGYILGRRLVHQNKISLKTGRTDNPILNYCSENSLRLHPAQQKLRQITKDHPHHRMIGSADQIQLLQNLARSINAKKTLDIGVFTGYSSLSVALVLPDDGKVVACDVSDEYASVGKPVWKEAGVYHKIDFRVGPASESLQRLIDNGETSSYDLAFIDANKDGYDDYYEKCLQLLRPGGFIMFDNMLQGGRVLDPQHETALIANALNKKLHRDSRVDVNMLLLGDGTYLAFKR